MGYLDTSGLRHLWGKVENRSLASRALTQAEYEALPEDEKNADTLFLVDGPPWVPATESVQEYDTETGWHVRKYSNGFFLITCHWTENTDWTRETNTNYIYSHLITDKPAPPFDIVEIYYEHTITERNPDRTQNLITTMNGGEYVVSWFGTTRPASVQCGYFAIGRWK